MKEYSIKEIKKLNKKYTGSYKLGECFVMVGLEVGWHLSISHPTRYPTYDEIKNARYHCLPDDIHMAMIFPPKDQFVNLHTNCFHLWEI